MITKIAKEVKKIFFSKCPCCEKENFVYLVDKNDNYHKVFNKCKHCMPKAFLESENEMIFAYYEEKK